MPVIEITMGPLDSDKKPVLIKELTDAAVKATNIPEDKFTVFIKELPFENIGNGGKSLKDFKV